MSLSSLPPPCLYMKPKSALSPQAPLSEWLSYPSCVNACLRPHGSQFTPVPDSGSGWCSAFLSYSCPYPHPLVIHQTSYHSRGPKDGGFGGTHESGRNKPGWFDQKNLSSRKTESSHTEQVQYISYHFSYISSSQCLGQSSDSMSLTRYGLSAAPIRVVFSCLLQGQVDTVSQF